jgi:hypothetical protein
LDGANQGATKRAFFGLGTSAFNSVAGAKFVIGIGIIAIFGIAV